MGIRLKIKFHAYGNRVSYGWNCSFIRLKFEFHTVETVVSYG